MRKSFVFFVCLVYKTHMHPNRAGEEMNRENKRNEGCLDLTYIRSNAPFR